MDLVQQAEVEAGRRDRVCAWAVGADDGEASLAVAAGRRFLASVAPPIAYDARVWEVEDVPLVRKTVSVPRGLLLWLTYGSLAPVLFTAVYLIEGATRPGYDGWRRSISALSLGPGGWLQQANFVFLGVNVLCMAVVWRRVLAGGIGAAWYPIMRGLEGLSLVVIGIFSTDPEPGYPPGSAPVQPFSTVHGIIHFACLFAIILAMMVGLFIMARRFWQDAHWRGWVLYSVISALLINLFIALFGVANGHDFAYAGVLERLATNVEAIWGLVLLGRLWAGVPFMDAASTSPPTVIEPIAGG